MPSRDYRLIIFDADGTLRRCTVEGQPCPNRPDEWTLIDGVYGHIQRLMNTERLIHFAIASNQRGVSAGYLSHDTAFAMLKDTYRAAFGSTVPIRERVWLAPADGVWPRPKPAPDMLLSIMSRVGVDPADTLMVGDSEDDRQAAKRAGCDFQWAWRFFGWPEPAVRS